jgi:hypothetical protein
VVKHWKVLPVKDVLWYLLEDISNTVLIATTDQEKMKLRRLNLLIVSFTELVVRKPKQQKI